MDGGTEPVIDHDTEGSSILGWGERRRGNSYANIVMERLIGHDGQEFSLREV